MKGMVSIVIGQTFPRRDAQRRRTGALRRTARLYAAAAAVWLCLLLLSAALFLSSRLEEETRRSGQANLDQYMSVADGYILKNLFAVENNVIQILDKMAAFHKYVRVEAGNRTAVDMQLLKNELAQVRTYNPGIQSAALWYDDARLLILDNFIRFPENSHLTFGHLLEHYEALAEVRQFYAVADQEFPTREFMSGVASETPDAVVEAVKPVVHVVRRNTYYVNGAQRGVYLVLTVSLDSLTKLWTYRETSGAELVISDHKGAQVYNSSSYDAAVLDSLFDSGGNSVTAELGGRRCMLTRQSSDLTGWTYYTYQPLLLGGFAWQFLRFLLPVMVAVTVLVMLLMYYVNRRLLYRPLNDLAYYCYTLLPGQVAPQDEYSIILSTIHRLTEQVDAHHAREEQSIPVLRQEYIRSLFYAGHISVGLSEWTDLVKVRLPYRGYCALLVEHRDAAAAEGVRLQAVFHGALENARVQWVSELCGAELLAVLNYDPETRTPRELAELLSAAAGTACRTPPRIFLGQPVNREKELQISAHTAQTARRYAYLLPENKTILYTDVVAREESKKSPADQPMQEYVRQLRSLELGPALRSLEKAVADLRASGCSLQQARRYLLWLEKAAEQLAQQTGAEEIWDASRAAVGAAPDILAFQREMAGFSQKYAAFFENLQTERSRELVQTALSYIRENILNTQLSLNGVSARLGISASYFCRIFKAETHVTFLDYVTEYKLQYSRQLLLESNLLIEQISERMGYSSPQYFAGRFKRRFGCSPKEFRIRERTKHV